MSDPVTNLVIGNVYEIDPYIKITVDGITYPHVYYARLVGFSSKNDAVFENDGRYFAVSSNAAKITPIAP
jgi:hypothetical protein